MVEKFIVSWPNNCPGKSENLKPQGSLNILPLWLFSEAGPLWEKKWEVAVIKFCKIQWKTPTVYFCFIYRAYNFISTEIELFSMLLLQLLRSCFSEMYSKAATVGVQG